MIDALGGGARSGRLELDSVQAELEAELARVGDTRAIVYIILGDAGELLATVALGGRGGLGITGEAARMLRRIRELPAEAELETVLRALTADHRCRCCGATIDVEGLCDVCLVTGEEVDDDCDGSEDTCPDCGGGSSPCCSADWW